MISHFRGSISTAIVLSASLSCQAQSFTSITDDTRAINVRDARLIEPAPAVHVQARQLATTRLDITPISARRASNRSGFAFIMGGNISLTLMPGEVFEFVGDAVESTDPNSQS